MKKIKNNLLLVVIFSLILIWIVFINVYYGLHPVLNIFQYLAHKNYLWLVPLFLAVLFSIWRHNINIKKKVSVERIEMFNATMRTIQDILQNSSSSMQLLILDMKEHEVQEEIILRAEKNIDELKAVIRTLADIDPATIKLEELNRKISIIKMDHD